MTNDNQDISTGKLVKNKTQVYLTDISDELVDNIFNTGVGSYVFRHADCPIVFTTDGNFLYAEDMDALNIDPVEKYGIDTLFYTYNNFQEFLDTFKLIEEQIGRELYLSDWANHFDASIRTLELIFKRQGTK
jgi:hypothetical protein